MHQLDRHPGVETGRPLPAQSTLVRLQQREHPMCVVCSPDNPHGLRLKFAVQADGAIATVFDCRPALESFSHVLHGGVIATILDSAMLYALFAIDVVAVTATLEVRYVAPTETSRFAMVRAWTENASSHPLYAQRSQLVQDGTVRVEARATFVVPGAL